MNCSCDFNDIYPGISCENTYAKSEGIFVLQDCKKETKFHLEAINAFDKRDTVNIDEKDLILIRCGIDTRNFHSYYTKTICAKHRNLLGIGWRQLKHCCNSHHSSKSSEILLQR